MVSQLLTLYITPVFYIYMERFRGLGRKRKPGSRHIDQVPEPAGALGD